MGPSGYSETMSERCPAAHIFGFAAASAVLLAACWLIDLRTADRVLLAAMVAATLFLGLKAAGVARTRDDMTGASALMVVAAVIVLLGAAAVAGFRSRPSLLRGGELRIDRLARRADRLATGARPCSGADASWLYATCDRSVARAADDPAPRTDARPPPTATSTRSRSQTCSAQGVDWNPRPVIQSYAAYTPGLAELNAETPHRAGRTGERLLQLLVHRRAGYRLSKTVPA